MQWFALIRIAYTTVGVTRSIVAALSSIWIAPILIVARVLLLVGRHGVVGSDVLVEVQAGAGGRFQSG